MGQSCLWENSIPSFSSEPAAAGVTSRSVSQGTPMRLLPWLVLAISLALATRAEARLFWQTYGSTVPTADGCAWNVNQDYFVPRYPTSCRYGLYSPCKESCTTSPACRTCHPLYPGYCSIYGPCHYHRRDRVYQAHCGCKPLGICARGCRQACRCGNVASCRCGGETTAYGEYMTYENPLYNVESSDYQILGSIPVDSAELISNLDLSQALGGNQAAGGQMLLQPQNPLDLLPSLPSLGMPKPEKQKPAGP